VVLIALDQATIRRNDLGRDQVVGGDPYALPRIPSPPSVNPATPTGGQVPAGMARPCSWSDSYTPPSGALAPTVATPPETDTEGIGVTSMTTPLRTERPAKQWPPLRVAHSNPFRPTNEIVSETSWGVAHWTMACGRRSWNRALNGLRNPS
jgi:hypothetical protein